jgi:hypothetical protein
MKKLRNYILLLCSVSFIFSCYKDKIRVDVPPGVATVNVINAAARVAVVHVNLSSFPVGYSAMQDTLVFGTASEAGIPPGAVPYQIYSPADTSHALLQGKLNLVNGGIYSLYVIGQAPKPDTLFVKEQFPHLYADSTVGIRVINLSPDAGPVNIDLVGSPNGQYEFTNVPYKGLTAFKKYAATTNVSGGYTFEVKDPANGTVLATYSFNLANSLFRTNTLVIAGLKANGTDPYGITMFQVNNF